MAKIQSPKTPSKKLNGLLRRQLYELIGDIITLLQSPAKNVISALQSGGNKLSGIVKTLQEKTS